LYQRYRTDYRYAIDTQPRSTVDRSAGRLIADLSPGHQRYHHPDFDRKGLQGWRAVHREATLPQTAWNAEREWVIRMGLAGADSIEDRSISTFARGELPHYAGINTFLNFSCPPRPADPSHSGRPKKTTVFRGCPSRNRKFESTPLQRRVNELSVPIDEGVFASADCRRQTELIARVECANSRRGHRLDRNRQPVLLAGAELPPADCRSAHVRQPELRARLLLHVPDGHRMYGTTYLVPLFLAQVRGFNRRVMRSDGQKPGCRRGTGSSNPSPSSEESMQTSSSGRARLIPLSPFLCDTVH
jgi:hypothetical protein